MNNCLTTRRPQVIVINKCLVDDHPAGFSQGVELMSWIMESVRMRNAAIAHVEVCRRYWSEQFHDRRKETNLDNQDTCASLLRPSSCIYHIQCLNGPLALHKTSGDEGHSDLEQLTPVVAQSL